MWSSSVDPPIVVALLQTPKLPISGAYHTVDMNRVTIWLKGILAAAISGAAGGVLTGFAAVGIDPQHFNLQSGSGATLRIGAAAALINAVIGVAAYLQKSPLPND
jgi:hypothetical protein